MFQVDADFFDKIREKDEWEKEQELQRQPAAEEAPDARP